MPARVPRQSGPATNGRNTNETGVLRLWLAMISLVLATMPAVAEETPKYGGTLTYMISADAPPTFDAQREQTYATGTRRRRSTRR